MNPTPLFIRGQRFIDPQGRQVLLHGINLVNKDPSIGYLDHESPEFFTRLRAWGFNCLRLGVIWDGLEPQPGAFNEAYLQGIDRQIELAGQHGLFVFLDMHQDLYSVLFSDGAPAWATLTDGAPHVTGGIWSDAYFTSPAVQAALDHFWENSPAPDGVGLQDHYARAWGILAQRYAQNPVVIGYDLMNEPFPGALAQEIQALMFAKGAEIAFSSPAAGEIGLAAGSTIDPVENLAQLWLTPEGRFQILQLLEDPSIYAQVIDATQPLYHEFEQTRLMGLYHRVAQATRQHDPAGFLFLETTMGSNMGVVSAIQPLTSPDGKQDLYQVYAPHGYDLVTDTVNLAQASSTRLEMIFHRHAQTAKRLNMPMLVGEWGAYGDMPGTLEAAWQVIRIFEDLQVSETYWAYIPEIENTDSFYAINRPYPERIAGKLESYHYDPGSKRFTCSWWEDGKVASPTQIYLPSWFNYDPRSIALSNRGREGQILSHISKRGDVWLQILPMGDIVRQELVIQGQSFSAR